MIRAHAGRAQSLQHASGDVRTGRDRASRCDRRRARCSGNASYCRRRTPPSRRLSIAWPAASRPRRCAHACCDLAIGTAWRAPERSSTCAVSSISGYNSLANSKYQPEGSTFGRFTLQSPLRRTSLVSSQSAARRTARAPAAHPGFAQRVRGDGRVPDRRKARLEKESALIVDQQVQELLLGFLNVGMILRIPQADPAP